ncbi:probable serine/threonine-protein kinase nek3 [Zophobas morio]|uniref:probable serine/threonine-protein kinase nek3 n=1 Tax=Zophobas morio TaxID=2755281 RepID=UPI0030830554
MSSKGHKCRVLLHQCLAIIVRKEGCRGDPGDFWMYENGYLLFQGLLSSNSVCWWNTGLNGATKSLSYHGYISPGALLVGSEPCAIDIVKNAWARRVLQPPPGYQIVALEDIENCYGIPVAQTQWTPLPEAVCAVILKLSRQGRPAGIETIREALIMTFPHVSPPSEQALYDTLVQLTTERKLYHTSNGYFIVTPERRRSRSASRGRKRVDDPEPDPVSGKTMLMSTEEALVMVHGDMATIRDGDVTHQLIQTNLADVICGGNPSDKVLYPRSSKYRASSLSVPRSPDRRGSFRLWRSSRRLRRSASTRTIAKHYVDTTSSSTETSAPSTPSPKKESLLSRLFKKTKRSQCQISSFSAQFPPTEWFNSKAVHLHSIGTQTSTSDKEIASITSYLEKCEIKASSRSATLPRRRCRQYPDLPYPPYPISRESSPVSRKPSSYVSCTLPRNKQKSRESSRKTSRSSLVRQHSDEQKSDLVNRICDSPVKPSQKSSEKLEPPALDNSGPSSIESHKSSSKTESSFNSGPSSLESHKTVINTKDTKVKKKREQNNRVSTSIPQSNSFTLQVTTNQGVSKLNNKPNATTTTTINGEGGSSTKIFVQNSPVRSVITFENGQGDDRNPNLVIINDTESSQYESKVPKNTNQSKETTLNNSRDLLPNGEDLKNNRKLSLQLPNKEGLSFHNLIKNVSTSSHKFSSTSNPDSPVIAHESPKGGYNSTPPSPTKSSDALSISSIGNMYAKNEMGSLSSFDTSKKLEKNMLGSEPNISYKDNRDQQFPSLNDLSFNFTSLAAQKILKGVGLNSVDTLVELNMTNVDKQNNCDVVHTDFGMF